MNKIINQNDLETYLQKWQTRLGLSDWKISIRFNDANDMDQNPAKTSIQTNIQNADMRVMCPEDRQYSDAGFADIELDIVHELIHIRLWSIDPLNAEGILYTCREQAIEWIAKALIESDRQILDVYENHKNNI